MMYSSSVLKQEGLGTMVAAKQLCNFSKVLNKLKFSHLLLK